MDPLLLITKAGVESRKIVVGISSSGRSFHMSDQSCSGSWCTYPDHSEAYKGRCTGGTSGYISNAEMQEIISDNSYAVIRNYYDRDSDSLILQYGDGNARDWVPYMDDELKESRTGWIQDIDMSDGDNINCPADMAPGNLEDLSNHDNLPMRCQALYALEILYNTLEDSLSLFVQTANEPYVGADPGIDEPFRLAGGASPPCHRLQHTRKNFPVKVDDKDGHVGNPKKIIEASMTNIAAVQDSILAFYTSVGFGVYSEGKPHVSEMDALTAYVMPVFQLQKSIGSMRDIKDIGKGAKEEKKKKLIMTIFTVVFMANPFVGEAIGAVAGTAASVAHIALIIPEAGNAALMIKDIVDDPASVPFAILGLIVGAGAGGGGSRLTKAEALGEAARVRGALKAEDLAKFPVRFRELDGQIQKIVKKFDGKVCHL